MDDAELLIIAYGCTARSARAAVRIGRERGMKIGLLQIISLWPFPRRPVSEALTGKIAAVVPELNLGQLRREVLRVNDGRNKCSWVEQDGRDNDHALGDPGSLSRGKIMSHVSRSVMYRMASP